MAKKLYYKIGEACKSLDIQPYVLRYWETEFSALKPSKSKSGQRVYSEQDLAVIRRIKELLYDEGYTIAGAKKKLDSEDLATLTAAEPKAAAKKKPKAAAKPKETAPEPEPEPEAAEEPASEPSSAAHPTMPGKVRKGIEKALAETRAILDLLDNSGG